MANVPQEALALEERIKEDVPLIIKLTDRTFIAVRQALWKVREELIGKYKISLHKRYNDEQEDAIGELILKSLLEKASVFLGTPSIYSPKKFPKEPVMLFQLGNHPTQLGPKDFYITFFKISTSALLKEPKETIVISPKDLWNFTHTTEPKASAVLYGIVAHELFHAFQSPSETAKALWNPYSSAEITACAFEVAGTMFYSDNARKRSFDKFRKCRIREVFDYSKVLGHSRSDYYLGERGRRLLKGIFPKLVSRYITHFDELSHEGLVLAAPQRLLKQQPIETAGTETILRQTVLDFK